MKETKTNMNFPDSYLIFQSHLENLPEDELVGVLRALSILAGIDIGRIIESTIIKNNLHKFDI